MTSRPITDWIYARVLTTHNHAPLRFVINCVGLHQNAYFSDTHEQNVPLASGNPFMTTMANVVNAPEDTPWRRWYLPTDPEGILMVALRYNQLGGLYGILREIFGQPDPRSQWHDICLTPRYNLDGCTRFIDRLDTIYAGIMSARWFISSYTTAAIVILLLLLWQELKVRLLRAIVSPSPPPSVLAILDITVFIVLGCHMFNAAFYWPYLEHGVLTNLPREDGLDAEASETLREIVFWLTMMFAWSGFGTLLFVVDLALHYGARWHARSGGRN